MRAARNVVALFAFVAASAPGVPGPVAARPDFAAPFLAYPVGDAPTGVAQGDFDQDTYVDVATCNFADNTITIRRGLGDGRLGPPTTRQTLAGPSSILAVQTSSSGADLIVTNYIAGGISLFRNGGSGGFTSRVDFEGEPGAVQAAWGDVNQDYRPDIVVANYLRNTIVVYDSRVGFSASDNFVAGPNPIGVLVGDLNGDGLNDVVVTNYSAATISLLPGEPAGYFRPRLPYEVLRKPLAALGTDLNGDGRMDVVVPGSEGGSVMVLRSDRGFDFDVRDTHATGSRPAAVVAGDLDRDGIPDLAVANSDARSVTLLKGTGGAGFRALATAACGPGPVALATDDLNGDGRLDLTVVAGGSDELSLLLGNGDGRFGTRVDLDTTAPPGLLVTADLNGDGLLDLIAAPAGAGALEIRLATGATAFAAPRRLGSFLRPVALAVEPATTGESPRVFVADAGANRVVVLDADWASGGADTAVEIPLGDGGELTALALVDLDGDARLDLAATLAASGRVAICPGDAGAATGFGPPRYTAVGPGASGLAGGDFNQDGVGDLAVTARGSDELLLLDGAPGAAVPRPRNIFAGLNLAAPVVDDFNRDGWPDLAAADGEAGTLRVFLNDGQGGLTGSGVYPSGQGAAALVLADINADGRRDLISANSGAGTVTSWLMTAEGTLRDRQDYGAGGRAMAVAAGSRATPARSHLFVADGTTHRIALLENGGVLTPVALLEFAAERADDDLILRWRVGEEGRRHAYRLFRSVGSEDESPVTSGWLTGQELYRVLDPGAATFGETAYRLADRAPDGTLRWFGPLHIAPAAPLEPARLRSPAPNPFRGHTAIEYTLAVAGPVWLVVHDVAGRVVRTLVDRVESAGAHALEWDGRTDRGGAAGGGVYLIRLEAAGHRQLRKVVRIPG